MSVLFLLILFISVLFAGDVGAADGEFSPPYSDYGRDDDGDELYNFLVFNATINVTEAGLFNIYGGLYDIDFDELITDDMKQRNLVVGESVVALEFDGIDIYGSEINGPYGAWLVLYDEEWILLDSDTNETNSYNYTEFQHTPAVFYPPHHDYGLDTDDNGLYNYLVAEVNVTVSTSGVFEIEGDLYDSTGDFFITDTANQTYLEKGNRTVQL
ncbi:MAG: hypothetical protein KAW09_02950, partial [Thermoplasmata archaeon]|nr:hypothetical protein [Thermoplasmata archaeon]